MIKEIKTKGMTHKFTRIAMSLFALVVLAGAALAADPGLPVPDTSEASDQKAGSLLFYNGYTSDATNAQTANTKINITNTNSLSQVAVHLFFVNGADCSVADSFICLTENQTATFATSDLDPGVNGYIVALATFATGEPRRFNFLIGDEYIKYASGHAANLGAVAFSKLTDTNVLSTDGSLAALFLDGQILAGSYNRAPRVVADDNIPARADGNDTLLILNRVGGNLGVGASTLGPLFGIIYDDAETPLSFNFSGGCQFRQSLSNTFPRITPRIETFIPAGRSGWFKIFSQSDIGILGAAINRNANAGTKANAFNGGHNLHHLRLSAAANYTIPVFPSNCPADQVSTAPAQ